MRETLFCRDYASVELMLFLCGNGPENIYVPAIRWSHAARHLSEAENIVVIGYSLPSSDEFFRFLYGLGTVGDKILRNFWVFDPQPPGQSVDERFRALLGEAAIKRYRYFPVGFQQAIGIASNLQ